MRAHPPEYPEKISDAWPIEETDRTIASDKVEGTAVYDLDGERLGHIHNFMIAKHSGEVLYAVMSFGGFLGIGDHYHPLPWKVLKYDEVRGGYVVGRSAEHTSELQLLVRNSYAVIYFKKQRNKGRLTFK